MRESIKELKEITQGYKRRPHKFLQSIGYKVHRDISIYITYTFLKLFPKIKPNTVSFLMLVVGMVGFVLLGTPDIIWQFAGVGLIYLSFILDKVDGEIARYKEEFSVLGMYLDETYHTLILVGTLAAFFLPFIGDDNQHVILLAVLVLLLSMYRRYERKSYILVSPKVEYILKEKQLSFRPLNKYVDKIFNSVLFKSTAVIERFDILLVVILGVVVFEHIGHEGTREGFLYSYAVVLCIYTVRRFVLQISGLIDTEVKTFSS